VISGLVLIILVGIIEVLIIGVLEIDGDGTTVLIMAGDGIMGTITGHTILFGILIITT
jgi:hypothetical protein